MTAGESNNRRIVKNTLFLYFRTLLIMAVSLYTSRVILKVLGIEDFGIYNVVGGVVVMLGFLNSSLAGAGSRFITFALGKDDVNEVKHIFSSVLCIHFILAGIILLLGETIGFWFILNKLVIPDARMTAAVWVYQCSILTAIISIISVPYNSLIIAHERMGAFAYISIFEVTLKLGIVWLLLAIPYDKLTVYAVLYLLVQLVIRVAYNYYCSIHFTEAHVRLSWNGKQIKNMVSYAGWTVNGNLAVIGCTQGINILLNLFFGPSVNAARAIATQVQTAAMTFVSNFQTAVRPQIIKSYAHSELEYMHTLIIASSKYGFYLMLVLSFPIILFIHPILKIWLGIVPVYTANFVCIMLLIGLIEPLKITLINAIHATGDIKKFQLYEGTSLLLIVPIIYFSLKQWHISPKMVFLSLFLMEILIQGIRIWIVLPKIGMPYKKYFQEVMLPIMYVSFFCTILSMIVDVKIASLGSLVGYVFGGLLFILLCVCLVGLNKNERYMMYDQIKHKFKSKYNE